MAGYHNASTWKSLRNRGQLCQAATLDPVDFRLLQTARLLFILLFLKGITQK